MAERPVPQQHRSSFANGETGCDDILETGDQLVGFSVPVGLNGFTHHPQTENILQWFTRETPSSALGGLYRFPTTRRCPTCRPDLSACR